MSWIFGFSGNLSEQKKLSLSSIYPPPILKIDKPRMFIAAGGSGYTLNYSAEQRWIVTGLGIEIDSDRSRMMLKQDWEKRIAGNSLRDFQGHYLLVKWDDDKINFYSDPVGLRTIYFYKDKTGVYFSSNLDWIISIMGKIEIDFKEFGSRWMTFNQLSNNSFIYDVLKLPPASSAEIITGTVKLQSDTWFPELSSSNPENLFGILKSYLLISLPDSLKMSFGLSGGLDSRFLLSLLLQNKKQNFNIHSFGYNDDADLQIAKKISDELALKCFFLQPHGMGSGQFLNKAGDYIAATQLIEPVSSYIKLAVLNNKYFEDKLLVDGALAEFARRQFLNRLLIKGKNALLNRKYPEVVRHLMVPKPGIFKPEFNEMMFESAIEQLKKIYETLPDPGEIGAENFVDLMIVKYRIPNYFGPEQSRLDNILPGFMPFAQRNTISASLGIPVEQRKNSQIFYKAIRDFYPALEDFPLVKNSTIYPYGLPSLASYAYTRIKKTFRKNSSVDALMNLFRTHEKAIKEIITRDEVREYRPYNEEAVMCIIDEFYSGKNTNTDDLNWLLTFEIFRKKLNITGS